MVGWLNVISISWDGITFFFLNFSILLKDSPIQALFSACALGILHHDNQLSETILTELKKRENSEKHVADIAYLTAQYYLVNVSFELYILGHSNYFFISGLETTSQSFELSYDTYSHFPPLCPIT